jgi:hypothetical protein
MIMAAFRSKMKVRGRNYYLRDHAVDGNRNLTHMRHHLVLFCAFTLGCSAAICHFGLNEMHTVDVEVKLPSGQRFVHEKVAANQQITIVEP